MIFIAAVCTESVESLLLQVGTRLDMMSCFGLARFYSAQLKELQGEANMPGGRSV